MSGVTDMRATDPLLGGIGKHTARATPRTDR
jgi:hypothetical protein